MTKTEERFALAKEQYASLGVDVEKAMAAADAVPVSLHCWQADDVGGFEGQGELTGGIQATGNYPGKARTPDEVRSDLEEALSLIPGTSKINLHASYLVTGGRKVDRDAIEPEDFSYWADWACEKGIGLDFNPTFFSHEKSGSGTLSSADPAIREFWVAHGIRSRRVGEYFGRRTGKTCVTNIWIPDGAKEIPVDTTAPRMRLIDSLDTILKEKIDPKYNVDAAESKLFGIGMEAYTVGSHEFYMGYCLSRGIVPTLDAGHFHPTEVISSKITALLCFAPKLLLHVSRPVRWDSDHVVLFDDELRQIMREVVRADAAGRVYLATDYFDASINRVAALAIGARNTRKALLAAYLEPTAELRRMEQAGDRTGVLALSQAALTLPLGAVWEEYCQTRGVPAGVDCLGEVRRYEREVLAKRS